MKKKRTTTSKNISRIRFTQSPNAQNSKCRRPENRENLERNVANFTLPYPAQWNPLGLQFWKKMSFLRCKNVPEGPKVQKAPADLHDLRSNIVRLPYTKRGGGGLGGRDQPDWARIGNTPKLEKWSKSVKWIRNQFFAEKSVFTNF